MEKIGVVTSVKDNYANIVIQRASACGSSCESCKGGCEVKEMEITVLNEIFAKVGDRVEIESDSKNILKILFLLYFVPFLFFVFGIALGVIFLKDITDKYEIISFAIGLIFLFISYKILKVFDSKHNNDSFVSIKRIIE